MRSCFCSWFIHLKGSQRYTRADQAPSDTIVLRGHARIQWPTIQAPKAKATIVSIANKCAFIPSSLSNPITSRSRFLLLCEQGKYQLSQIVLSPSFKELGNTDPSLLL